MSGAADPTEPNMRPMPLEEQAMLGLVAAVFAGGTVWGAHQILPSTWPLGSIDMGSVDLWGWTKFTFGNWSNDALLHAEWLKLWQVGYHHYLAVLTAVGLGVWSLFFARATRRPLRATMLAVLIGAALGAVAGYASAFLPSVTALHVVLAWPGCMIFGGVFGAIVTDPAKPDPVIRGARVEADRVRTVRASVIEKASRSDRIVFAGQILEPSIEPEHFVAIGKSGSGKSTVIKAMVANLTARDDQGIIADPGGEMLASFWREGDLVLNPFDARCAKWDLFSDICEDADHDTMAAALLPLLGTAEGDQWVRSARELLADLMRAYRALGAGGSDDFAHWLRTASPDAMGDLLRGTDEGLDSASLFDEGNERPRGSVLKYVAPAKRTLRRMAEIDGKPLSIRDWVQNGRGRLWLPYRMNQIDSLRIMIGCWLGAASKEVTSLPASDTRRLWFVADELDMLGPVADLKDGLTTGRKNGACFVLGFQSMSQLRETYGENVSSTIEENTGSRVILRSEGFGPNGTAEYASRMIGEREVAFEEVSVSDGGAGRPGTTSRSVRRRTERAVLPSEIGQLPKLTGFAKLGDEGEWRKVRVPVRDYPSVTEPFVPIDRPGDDGPTNDNDPTSGERPEAAE